MAEAATSRLILGTAGHIDHGKTSLVRALTGVDTDRLKEEKARGITIELGFAALDLPDGRVMSIVDVPGHERFVRNMVAGATGIDTLLFVVAADEGVMLQTREHLEICSLLGISSGVIALTKADMVDEEFIELVRDDVASLVEGTFLEEAPMIPVSSTTGDGVEELRAELVKLAAAINPRDAKGLFRLPVDRVFTMKGFGTVVTGTALSGAVKRDDEIEILPPGHRAKLRGVQVHGDSVDKAYAGNRTALNFTGLSMDQISRGDIVAHPDTLETTRMADATLDLLASCKKPLEGRMRFRMHVGTREVPVVAALLDTEVLHPGQRGLVQLRSKEPFIVCPGDRFVLRSYSPAITVGGGVILDHAPTRHKGIKDEVIETLTILGGDDQSKKLETFLRLRGALGLTPQTTQATLDVTLEQARKLLQAAVRTGAALVVDRKAQRHVHTGQIEEIAERALSILENFHGENPLKKGLGIEELRTKFPHFVDPKVVAFALDRMAEQERVVLDGELVRSAGFTLQLSSDDEKLRGDILSIVRGRGYEAPTAAEIAGAVGEDEKALRPVLDLIASDGVLTRTKEGFYFDRQMLDALVEKVIDLLEHNGQITVADVKDFAGTSRKYSIPLLEYLDTNKITLRNGDFRVPGPKGKRK